MSTETVTPANPFRTPIVTNSKSPRVFPGGFSMPVLPDGAWQDAKDKTGPDPPWGSGPWSAQQGAVQVPLFYSAVYRVRTVAICARLAVLSGARVLLPIPEITPSPTAQVMASTA